jgi:hypothetical protein
MMHHFTTLTWLTLAPDENARQMWHVVVPQLALQNEHLLQALLACSALHVAYLNPEQHLEMIIQARTHQDNAMRLFLATVPSVESETCDAVLLFARLIAITAFSLDEGLFLIGGEEDKLPSWLFFIRSGCK